MRVGGIGNQRANLIHDWPFHAADVLQGSLIEGPLDHGRADVTPIRGAHAASDGVGFAALIIEDASESPAP